MHSYEFFYGIHDEERETERMESEMYDAEPADEDDDPNVCMCGNDNLPGRGMCAACTAWWDTLQRGEV